MDQGHEVSFLDAEVGQWDPAKHCEYLARAKYDVLGISALINKYEYVRTLAKASRETHPHARIVLGGNITGPIWELLLQRTDIDVLVIGEGEKTIQEVLQAFEGRIDLETIEGIAFRHKGQPCLTTSRAPIANLDDIPFPAYDIFPMEAYLTTPGKLAKKGFGSRDLTMITSRGCPFHCTFCYRPPWQRFRQRSCENVGLEVQYLKDNFGVDGITFNDELTLVRKENAYELCDTMERIGILWGCVGRVNTVDQDLLRRMYQSGCRWMTYGIESGSQLILNEMRKAVTVTQAKNAVIWTKEAGIVTNPTFMLGYPSESRDTAMETVEFMKDTDLHPDSLFFPAPYPGTELFEQAVNMGRISASVEEYLSYIDGRDAHTLLANLTQMSDQELIALRDEILNSVKRVEALRPELHLWPRFFGQAIIVIREEGWKAFSRKAAGKLKRLFYT